jgi:hypothetical protein
MPQAGEPRRVSLEVDLDAAPIEGRVYVEEDEMDLPFTGWLGLITAIGTAGDSTPRRLGRAREQ